MNLNVNGERLIGQLNELADRSDCPEPPPAVTRVVFTQTDLAAREYLRGRYEEAGLDIRVDAVGNTYARWMGDDPDAAVVGTGSHTDAIPFAGMYDGTVGVLGGLEAIRTLQEAGFRPRRSIELLMITSEEPTRFGVGCTGSRVMAGLMDDAAMDRLVDGEGDSFNTVRAAAGFSGSVQSAFLAPDYYHAWIELHIEQGPELEAAQLPIGIVTAIAAPATLTVEVNGQGGHAGAVLMPRRRDALCGAAEMIAKIESLAKSSPSGDLVATVGKLDVHPGAVNSIPRRVTFTVDLRDIDQANRDRIKTEIESSVASIAAARELTATTETLNSDPPAVSSPAIIGAAQAACDEAGLPYQMMISRAYHDSLFIARIAPIAMLFIPCRDGVSHRPDEYSTPEQITAGVEVLARTLAKLASQ